jgi:metal-responsive CopG/Arc/MetJ family transcriptional regulator
MCIRMPFMRTTVELTDEQRAELLRLAAKKGIKGFSQLVQEAVDEYLRHQRANEEAVSAALFLEGCLAGRVAEAFEKRVHSLRELWRCS